jgi:serine/threonine protein kinase
MKTRSFQYTQDGIEHHFAMPASGSLVIGSAPGPDSPNTLALQGSGIEDSHCVVGHTKSGGLAIKVLSQAAELQVNGESTRAARLRTGDKIAIGTITLSVCKVDAGSLKEAGQSAARVTPATASVRARSSSSKGKLPERIGGFRIERVLGKGGMGEVLLAVQESLARQVALKLLNPKLGADADFVSRFQAEARAAAALNHPNVVHVYDVGVADGRHYLAMEYMAGGTLEDRVRKQGPLGWAEVQHVLRETAKGLAYAEDRGIVHRDIKPDNLMIDGAGAIKLSDLGLATGNEAESVDGKILGTPHFMAPEQARGGVVDHRADLYALGATAWRLLTAKTPFEGETTRDILRAHFTEDVRPPSSIIPGIPASLDAIILKLMARAPEDRFSSARALSLAIAEGMPNAAAQTKSKLPLVAVSALVVVAIAFAAFKGDSEDPKNQPVKPGVVNVEPREQNLPGVFPEMPKVITDDGSAKAVAGGSDDALKNLENLAEQAYRGLQLIEDPTARMTALTDLATSFQGTSVATEALVERETLKNALKAAEAAAAVEAGRLSDILSVFTVVVNQAEKTASGAPVDPDGLLAILLDLVGPGDLESAVKFEAERDNRLASTLSLASSYADSELASADALAENGDFPGYRGKLGALLPYFALTSLEGDLAANGDAPNEGEQGRIEPTGSETVESHSGQTLPPQNDPGAFEESTDQQEWRSRLNPIGLDNFLAQHLRTAELLAGSELREIAYLQALGRSDQASMATVFSPTGPKSFESLLAQMKLADAAALLDSVLPKLKTPASRLAVQTLSSELKSGAMAHALLVKTFAAGEWKRNTLPDPRGSSKEASSIDKSGVTLGTREGTKVITWDQYSVQPDLVDKLFRNRLDREFTLVEEQGIASLCRVAAVLHALSEADRILIPERLRRFETGDVESMLQGFQTANDWAVSDLAVAEANTRELSAATVLGRALLARAEGKPSIASAHLKYLLDSFHDSLLVLLLSDGSDRHLD